MTPENNYEQTIIFCGGSDMPDYYWGNYSWPFYNTWDYPASPKCHRITPEPADGSAPAYVEDDSMFEGRTMGQFIILPDGTMLVVNGGQNGTAGYSTRTLNVTDYGDMPYGMSLASGPVLQPAIYNPNAPAGQRWSNAGLGSGKYPRLYHSSAILLPSGAVIIAGSNPNVDVNTTTYFPTTYEAELFFPPYFSAPVRPQPTGIPQNLTYGGSPFDITVPASSYWGSSNSAADNSSVVIIRQGFTTHGMNMGQRFMKLNNTYTVNQDGSIVLHTSPLPPNPNLFPPGPAFVYVVVNGIPSNGSYVIIGNGEIGTQPTSAVMPLPTNTRVDSAQGSGPSPSGSANGTSGNSGSGSSGGSGGNDNKTNGAATHTGAILGSALAAIALVNLFLGL